MAYVLAIEPDEEQATLLREALKARSKAKLKTVDSIESATTAIAEQIPQLVLLTSLIPPRQESTLLARLRNLPRESTPQVLLMPRLEKSERSPAAPTTLGGRIKAKPMLLWRFSMDTVLGRFRKKPFRPKGCDPQVFVEQALEYLESAGKPSRHSLQRDRRISIRRAQLKWASAAVDGIDVELVDLSSTGVQIVAPMKLAPTRSVRVQLSSDDGEVVSEAKVVWGGIETEGPDAGPWYRTGLTFKPAYYSAIEHFCTYEERMINEETFWSIPPGTSVALMKKQDAAPEAPQWRG